MQIAVAAVGSAPPAWAPEACVVDPAAAEAGLNAALAGTTARFFLPVQQDDSYDPAALERLAGALERAHRAAFGAWGATDRVRRDGTLRKVIPATLRSLAELERRERTPTPVLLRTGALRQAGGWRPGEAAWGSRAGRHRGLLARLLGPGGGWLLGVDQYLGVTARGLQAAGGTGEAPGRPHGSMTRPGLTLALAPLLYHRVRLTGPGLEITGRLAHIGPDLLTLSTGREGVTLVQTARVTAAELMI